jgi:hypothetical protein
MMRVHTRVVWQWRDGALVELPEEGESYEYEGPVALAGAGTPVSRITHYRGRSDTGAVDGAPSWIAAEDTSFGVTVGTNFRIRIGVENTGTASDTVIAPDATRGIARCGYATGTFANLANIINGADAGSSADAANIATQRLTSGTGSFATGTGGYDESEVISCAVANGNFTEVEFGVVLTGGASTIGAGGGETYTFEVGGLTDASAVVPTFTTPNTNGSDFQHGAQLGGAGQQTANSSSISMTTAAAASANNLVVVVVTCDNNGTTDGDLSEVSSVSIGGNAATKAVEFTNGQGVAQTGITTSVWWLQLGSALGSGSTITANIANATTSGDALTIQAREFIVASGKTVSVEAVNSAATDGTAQPASIDCTTSNIECLRVAAFGAERIPISASTDADNLVRASNSAWSLWWTSGALARSSLDNDGTGTGQIVEATISTGTGAASRIGAVSANSDWAACYVAFKATAASSDSPLSATGTGTATLVGASTAVAPLSATGTGTATFVGASTAVAPFSITGTGTATLVGAPTADGTLSATGTWTATFVSAAEDAKAFSMTGTGTGLFTGASQADSVLAATGTGTADFVGLEVVTVAPFSMTGTGTALLVGASDASASLSATGTGTATLVGAGDAGAILAATGAGTALLIGASQADSAFSVTGTATAAFVGASNADSILAATGTATVSFSYANGGEGALTATGNGVATFASASDAEAALAATGTGTADFVGEGAAGATDAVFDASGTGTASFVGASDVAAQAQAEAGGGGAFPGAWSTRTKKKRKKKDELDDLIAQLKEQIVPWREAQEVGAQIMLRAELEHALTISLDNTIDEIESEIATLKEVLAEMDDEEALLLLM